MDETLLSRLLDPDPEVRAEAIDAIAQTPVDPDVLACLIDRLRDEDRALRIKARVALKKLTRRDFAFCWDTWTHWWKDHAWLQCNRCRRPLFNQTLYYRVQVQVTSEPLEIILTDEDLSQDPQAEIDRLCDEMNRRDPEELAEDVYVQMGYFLCTSCKRTWIADVKRGPRSPPPP